jgi:hypothetical protein
MPDEGSRQIATTIPGMVQIFKRILPGSDIQVMLAVRRSSRQIVVTDEELEVVISK